MTAGAGEPSGEAAGQAVGTGLAELADRIVGGDVEARAAIVTELSGRGWTVDLTTSGPVDAVRLVAAMSAAPEWNDDDKLLLLADLAEHVVARHFLTAYPGDERPGGVLEAIRRWAHNEGNRHDLAQALDDAEDAFVDLGRRIEASPDGEGVIVRYSCPQAGHALHALWCFADLARVWFEGTWLVRELLEHAALAAESAAGDDPASSSAAGREIQTELLQVALRRMELGPENQRSR